MTLTISQAQQTVRRQTDRQFISDRIGDFAHRRVDVVAPMRALGYRTSVGDSPVSGRAREFPPIVTDDGVTAGRFPLTIARTALRDIAARCRVPLAYLDRLADGREPFSVRVLASRNLNTIVTESPVGDAPALFRLLRCDDGWLVRSISSERYRVIDNVDVLVAVAQGMSQHGLDLADCEVDVDLSADRFRMRVAVPSVARPVNTARGYRWPYPDSRRPPVDNRWAVAGAAAPLLWAGYEVRNSETGQGALSVVPRVVFQICRNGATRAVDTYRAVHVGSPIGVGRIDWSAETNRQHLRLISSQVSDAIATFTSMSYLDEWAVRMDQAAGVIVANESAAVDEVSLTVGFSDNERQAALSAFARGGHRSVWGLSQAVAAVAALAEDDERQGELEAFADVMLDHPTRFVGAAAVQRRRPRRVNPDSFADAVREFEDAMFAPTPEAATPDGPTTATNADGVTIEFSP